MAKRNSTSAPRNPLVNQDNPGDTLSFCAAVLEYIGESTDDGAPTDNYDFGRYLVLRTVTEALRYESDRVTDNGREKSHG